MHLFHLLQSLNVTYVQVISLTQGKAPKTLIWKKKKTRKKKVMKETYLKWCEINQNKYYLCHNVQ